MQRPQDPYDYTRVDSWFRQAVDPKVFTINRPPFLGEIRFCEDFHTTNKSFEHHYYYLDGVLVAHMVMELKNGQPIVCRLYQLGADDVKKFSGNPEEESQAALLQLLQEKSFKPIGSAVPNRNVRLSSLEHP